MATGLRSRMSIEHVVGEVGGHPGRLDPRDRLQLALDLAAVSTSRIGVPRSSSTHLPTSAGSVYWLPCTVDVAHVEQRRGEHGDDGDDDQHDDRRRSRPTAAAGGSSARCTAMSPGPQPRVDRFGRGRLRRRRASSRWSVASMTIVDRLPRSSAAAWISRSRCSASPSRYSASPGWSSSAMTIVRRPPVGCAGADRHPFARRRGRHRLGGQRIDRGHRAGDRLRATAVTATRPAAPARRAWPPAWPASPRPATPWRSPCSTPWPTSTASRVAAFTAWASAVPRSGLAARAPGGHRRAVAVGDLLDVGQVDHRGPCRRDGGLGTVVGDVIASTGTGATALASATASSPSGSARVGIVERQPGGVHAEDPVDRRVVEVVDDVAGPCRVGGERGEQLLEDARRGTGWSGSSRPLIDDPRPSTDRRRPSAKPTRRTSLRRTMPGLVGDAARGPPRSRRARRRPAARRRPG